MVKLLTVCLCICLSSEADLSREDFMGAAPTWPHLVSKLPSWNDLNDLIEQIPVADMQNCYRDYNEAYYACENQGKKLTVIKNMVNWREEAEKARAKGHLVYITKDDPRFPDGVSVYYPTVFEQYQPTQFYQSGFSGGSC